METKSVYGQRKFEHLHFCKNTLLTMTLVQLGQGNTFK